MKGGQAKAVADKHLSSHSALVSWSAGGMCVGRDATSCSVWSKALCQVRQALHLPGALLCPYNILNPCHTPLREVQMAGNGDVSKMDYEPLALRVINEGRCASRPEAGLITRALLSVSLL